ncbi:MAG TPA: RidA family protein [Dehalococcoidia bacterium]|nr:RidA family protein [Dehalococcoidia bacterium]
MASNTRRRAFFAEGGQTHASPIPEGVVAGGFIFLSAVRGVDLKTQQVESDDIETQTRLAFEAMKIALKTAGATIDDVVKIAVFFKDMNDRVGFNKVWAETFPENPPARYAIQAVDFGVVGDKSRVLLDVTALAP